MARAKLFINGVNSIFLESEIIKESDRAIDQTKFRLPPSVDVCVNDCLDYLQDFADLTNLTAIYHFQSSILDESGIGNDPRGSVNIPSAKSHWKFECNLADDGQMNNTLTVSTCGSTLFTCGDIIGECKAFDFNGCTTLISPNECNYDFDRDEKQSFNGRVYFNALCSEEVILAKGNDTGTTVGFYLYKLANNKIRFSLVDVCGNQFFVDSCTTLTAATFFHIVATYGGKSNQDRLKLYINGILDATGASSSISLSIKNDLAFTLGGESDDGQRMTGRLDDVRAITGELTADEVKALYILGTHEYVDGKFRKALRFKSDTLVEVSFLAHGEPLDFCGAFDIFTWVKTTNNCAIQTFISKRTTACNGYSLSFTATGAIEGTVACLTLTSCSTCLDDGCYHLVELKRDGCNTVTLLVDNISEGTGCNATDLTIAKDLIFGDDFGCSTHFAGDMNLVRIYKGSTLTNPDACNIFTIRNPTYTMKFGGQATKIQKNIEGKDVIAQSNGKQLGEIEVRVKLYDCKSPEFIIRDIITNNTSLTTRPFPGNSGIIISRFTSDGKISDVIRDLSSLIGATFYTTPRGELINEPLSFSLLPITYTHGCNASILDTSFDDTELVNDLLVIGENRRFTTTCELSGDGCKTCFTLAETATTVRVEHPPCTELSPEIDYLVDTLGKSIKFTCAPACGSCNIIVDYEFERPLYIRGIKQSSIDIHGVHAKRLILPWIRTRSDGTKFIQSYLNRFSEVRKRMTVELPTLANNIRENDVITIINAIKSIDASFVIKSIKWMYPKFRTTLEVGEYSFDEYEYDRQIAEKIHDLEAAVTVVKDLRDFETFEQPLCLTDSFNIICSSSCGTQYTESLSLSDSQCVEEVFVAVYCACTTEYDTDDIYGT